MRPPSTQTTLLASGPVFFGSWGLAIWSGYQWTQHPDAWPVAIGFGVLIAAVMKADEQVKAYRAWLREWNALGGDVPHARGKPSLWTILAMMVAVPLLSLLIYAGQHGGGQAVTGVLLIFGAPVLGIVALVKLWRAIRRRRAKRSARVQTAQIVIKGPIVLVPSLDAAFQALPGYCHELLGGQS